MKVIIRPLKITDSIISWKWRNDSKIWKYTINKPDRIVTPEIETKWLKMVLKKPNEKRFAICIGTNKKYVGNIQLTDISKHDAQLHYFIGERFFWGKKIATKAVSLIIDYAFENLKLKRIYSFVNKNNKVSIYLLKSNGFVKIYKNNSQIKFCLNND